MTARTAPDKGSGKPQVVASWAASPSFRKAVETAEISAQQVLMVAGFYTGWLSAERARKAEAASLVTAIMQAPAQPELSQKELANAYRVRELRQHLITGPPGGLNYEQLAQARESSVEAARRLVSRYQEARHLFVVRNRDEVIIPRFFFDETFDPVKGYEPVIRVLEHGRVSSWGMWAWLAGPSRLLGGEVPSQLIATQPERVLEAAQERFTPVR